MTSSTASSVPYYEAFAREYALFFRDLPGNMVQEGEWLDLVFRAQGVRRVLDASCGSGRQTIPLAQRGYTVTAADPCGAMLGEARRQAAAGGLPVTWVQGRFIDLPALIAAPYDAAIALGNGLCHQETLDDIRASLLALRRCLTPGGLCLIGIKDYDRIRRERPHFHGHPVHAEPGGQALLFEVWSFEDPVLVCTTVCLRERNGSWSSHSGSTREYMLSASMLAVAARENGFERVERLSHPAEAVYALWAEGAAPDEMRAAARRARRGSPSLSGRIYDTALTTSAEATSTSTGNL